MYFKSICLVYFAIVFHLAVASGQKVCVLQGQIQDEQAVPMQYVNVGVYLDDAFVTGGITDARGHFALSVDCEQLYQVQISSVGYEQLVLEAAVAAPSAGVKKYTLIASAKLLDEVTVTSKRPTIEQKADRLIYHVDTSFLTGIHSAFEVLETTPSVWIESNGEIRINGRRGARVMVNGKLLQLGGAQLQSYLAGLDGRQIARIEVVSIPGSEFDADTEAGLVNIIMRKKFLDGYNARLFAGYEQGEFPETSTGIFSNYKTGKLTTTANFYIFERNNFTDALETRLNPATQFDLATDTYTKREVNNNQVRLGADYDFNPSHNLNFEYVRTYNRNEFDTDAQSTLLQNKSQSEIDGLYESKSINVYQGTSLNYRWLTDSLGSNLKVLLDYVDNDNETEGLYASDYFADDGRFLQNNTTRNEIEQLSKIFAGKIDYQHRFAAGGVFQAGVKYNSSEINNDLVEKDKLNGEFVVNPKRTDEFRYTESIMAAYLNYAGSIKRLQYKFGLRMEESDIEGVTQTQENDFKRRFTNWFPSAFLSWVVDEKKRHTLSAAANRKIRRPSYEALNPFEYALSEFTVSKGNPLLLPEYTSTIELGYTFLNKYSLRLYRRNTEDIINRVLLPDQETAIYQTQNIAERDIYGASLSLPFQLVKKHLRTQFYLFALHKSYVSDIVDESRGTLGFKWNNNLSLKNGLRASLSARYSTKELYGNRIYNAFWQVDAKVSQTFFNQKLRVSLGALDIFRTQNNNAVLVDSEEQITVRELFQSRKFQIFLFYNFKVGKSFRKKRMEYSTDGGEKSRLRQ
ncbi:MAG: outer membrane beta-barrel family protein [Bacteroidota bacterium]